jgi:hypothetical protein
MLAPLDYHIHHALHLVLGAEPAPFLAIRIEARPFAAPSMLALLALGIHHALHLMLATRTCPLSLPSKLKQGPLLHPACSHLLFLYINHTLHLVLGAESTPRLAPPHPKKIKSWVFMLIFTYERL